MLRSKFVVFAMVLGLAACGSPPQPSSPDGEATQDTPSDEPSSSSTDQPSASDGAEPAATGASETPASSEGSETETLARDFIKKGGRYIGYSATKKSFAYPYEQRRSDGFRLDIFFTDEEGRKKDIMQVCDFSECAERLNELTKEIIPKLASRLDSDGYVSLRGIGWPSGRDELEVGTLGMKLKYQNGKLEALREGKPNATLGKVGSGQELLAIFVVPDSKKLALFAKPSGGGAVQEFYVLKLP